MLPGNLPPAMETAESARFSSSRLTVSEAAELLFPQPVTKTADSTNAAASNFNGNDFKVLRLLVMCPRPKRGGVSPGFIPAERTILHGGSMTVHKARIDPFIMARERAGVTGREKQTVRG